MNGRLDPIREHYAEALGNYLERPGEEPLRAGYELGRAAVAAQLSVLELAEIHHEALAAHVQADRAVAAGGEFFLESLSAFEMMQRVLRESREAALLEQRHAAILRRLSAFLADASIALDGTASLEEMLHLVAEHARELVQAERSSAWLRLNEVSIETDADAPAGEGLSVPMHALDGREIGMIEVSGKHDGAFSELDEAVLAQLAQMAAAAVERAQLYR